MKDMSLYHRMQYESINTTFEACQRLAEKDKSILREMASQYMEFRTELQQFTDRYFSSYCKRICFDTKRSACCSYESIIVFFADEVINYLFGGEQNFPHILEKLRNIKPSDHCVYLGDSGCLWTVRPISCAMFFCDDAKKEIFGTFPEAELEWQDFIRREKLFTWPDQPVLFDILEEFFIKRGVNTPHMYCHRSPGLLKIKARSRQISYSSGS
ncbi:MAG: hypothetical protein WHS38_06530 [Thermodesulforhabdaceae bacterium]